MEPMLAEEDVRDASSLAILQALLSGGVGEGGMPTPAGVGNAHAIAHFLATAPDGALADQDSDDDNATASEGEDEDRANFAADPRALSQQAGVPDGENETEGGFGNEPNLEKSPPDPRANQVRAAMEDNPLLLQDSVGYAKEGDPNAAELAEWYATLFNDLTDAGTPPDQDAIDAADEELEGTGYGIDLDEDTGLWEVREEDDDDEEGAEQYGKGDSWQAYTGKRGARKGSQGWKKGGRVVWGEKPPSSRPRLGPGELKSRAVGKATPSPEKTATSLKERLAPHAAELTDWHKGNAKRSLAMLRRHHGQEGAAARAHDIADTVESALKDLEASDLPKRRKEALAGRLKKRLAQLHAVGDLAETSDTDLDFGMEAMYPPGTLPTRQGESPDEKERRAARGRDLHADRANVRARKDAESPPEGDDRRFGAKVNLPAPADDQAFLDSVHKAARNVQDPISGKRRHEQANWETHKPLIADVYDSMKDQLGDMSLDQFKARLLKANQEGGANLNSLDAVGSAQPASGEKPGSKEAIAALERSRINHLVGTGYFHRIDSDEGQLRKKPVRNEPISHPPAFSAIPSGQEGFINGYRVRRDGDTFKLETDRGQITGNPDLINEHIGHQSKHEAVDRKRIEAAMARHAEAGEAQPLTPTYVAQDEAFGRIRDGTDVVMTEGNHAGRTGKIERDESGTPRVKLRGTPGLVPVTPSAVEPLDPAASWRVKDEDRPPAEPVARQGGLFEPGKVNPPPFPDAPTPAVAPKPAAPATLDEGIRHAEAAHADPSPANVAQLGETLKRMDKPQLIALGDHLGIKVGGKQSTMAAKLLKEATRRLTDRQAKAREDRKAGVNPAVIKAADKADAVKEAEEAGVDPEQMFAAADMVRDNHNEHAKDVKSLIARAYAAYPALSGGKKLTRNMPGFKDQDYNAIPGFNNLARSLAGEFPGLLGSHGYSSETGAEDSTPASEKLMHLLLAGPPELMSHKDAYREGLERVLRSGPFVRKQEPEAEDSGEPFDFPSPPNTGGNPSPEKTTISVDNPSPAGYNPSSGETQPPAKETKVETATAPKLVAKNEERAQWAEERRAAVLPKIEEWGNGRSDLTPEIRDFLQNSTDGEFWMDSLSGSPADIVRAAKFVVAKQAKQAQAKASSPAGTSSGLPTVTVRVAKEGTHTGRGTFQLKNGEEVPWGQHLEDKAVPLVNGKEGFAKNGSRFLEVHSDDAAKIKDGALIGAGSYEDAASIRRAENTGVDMDEVNSGRSVRPVKVEGRGSAFTDSQGKQRVRLYVANVGV